MDSEADDYEVLDRLVTAQLRWVIRLSENRLLANAAAGGPRKLRDFIANCSVLCERDVHLSRRRRQPGGGRKRGCAREERNATLSISVAQVAFQRPRDSPADSASVTVNVVIAREHNPPAGVEPVEWILATTEPIDTKAQALKVIDLYRARWRIEEYFKALKTGCAFEKRQLESWHTR
jgi:hypothetical protein